MSSKNVLITGVTSGLGKEFAQAFLRKGYTVFGSARKPDSTPELKSIFADHFHEVVFDVTDVHALSKAAEQLQGHIGKDGLYAIINNSGIHMPGPLSEISSEDFEQPFKVNTTGVLNVTNTFLPLLKLASRKGHQPRIINISSFSGKFTIPFTGAYAASKRALDAITDGYRRELMPYGIQVTSICLGPVETPIYGKAVQTIEQHQSQFSKSDYAECMEIALNALDNRAKASVNKVAQKVLQVAGKSRVKLEYVVGDNLLVNYYMPRYLPKRIVDRIFAKKLGISKVQPN